MKKFYCFNSNNMNQYVLVKGRNRQKVEKFAKDILGPLYNLNIDLIINELNTEKSKATQLYNFTTYYE